MLILTYMFKHDTFYIFHPYFHKERGFGVPIFYLTGIIKKIDEIKRILYFENHACSLCIVDTKNNKLRE